MHIVLFFLTMLGGIIAFCTALADEKKESKHHESLSWDEKSVRLIRRHKRKLLVVSLVVFVVSACATDWSDRQKEKESQEASTLLQNRILEKITDYSAEIQIRYKFGNDPVYGKYTDWLNAVSLQEYEKEFKKLGSGQFETTPRAELFSISLNGLSGHKPYTEQALEMTPSSSFLLGPTSQGIGNLLSQPIFRLTAQPRETTAKEPELDILYSTWGLDLKNTRIIHFPDTDEFIVEYPLIKGEFQSDSESIVSLIDFEDKRVEIRIILPTLQDAADDAVNLDYLTINPHDRESLALTGFKKTRKGDVWTFEIDLPSDLRSLLSLRSEVSKVRF